MAAEEEGHRRCQERRRGEWKIQKQTYSNTCCNGYCNGRFDDIIKKKRQKETKGERRKENKTPDVVAKVATVAAKDDWFGISQ